MGKSHCAPIISVTIHHDEEGQPTGFIVSGGRATVTQHTRPHQLRISVFDVFSAIMYCDLEHSVDYSQLIDFLKKQNVRGAN